MSDLSNSPNPVLVEVWRGNLVESRHLGAVAVCDGAGKVMKAWGAVADAVYCRSAAKPLQALALAASGAADHFSLGDAELALACASHSGEDAHRGRIAAWLAGLGLTESDLACGAHAPLHAPTAERMSAAGIKPGALCHNCSGKHAGILTLCRHIGAPTAGYLNYDHPAQRKIAEGLGHAFGCDMAHAPWAADGCGIPAFAPPLTALAAGMARLADPAFLAEPWRFAALRIRSAMTAYPHLVAGSGRFDTRLMTALAGHAAIKGGAEGVHAAVLPGLGLGVAIKIDDGAGRASEAAMMAVLDRLGALRNMDAKERDALAEPAILNAAGVVVGKVRAVFD